MSWNKCQNCGKEDSSTNSRNGGMGFRYCDKCYKEILEDESNVAHSELKRYHDIQKRAAEAYDEELKEQKEKEYQRTHCEDCGKKHSNQHTNLCTNCYNQKYGSWKERCVKCGSKNDNDRSNWCLNCIREYQKSFYTHDNKSTIQ